MEITKEKLIEAGGNIWEKNNMKRVYLTDDVLIKVFGFKLVTDAKYRGEFRSINKTKTYFNLIDNTLHSNEGRVRVLFAQADFKCFK